MSNTSDKTAVHNMQVIKASAGSGKTYTLARRYIEELLFDVELTNETDSDGKYKYRLKSLRENSDYYQHILAITFTNKATNEMKKRIVDELDVLAQDPGESDFYKNEWKDRMPCSVDELKTAASNALASILFNYSEFKVSTIDSFFQSVLRSFARELKRDYNYDLMLDGDYAASVAAHNFLLSLGNTARKAQGKQTTVEKWVKDFINDGEGGKWNTIFGTGDESLSKFAANVNKEFFRDHMEDLSKYLQNMTKIERFAKYLRDRADECRKHYEDNALWMSEFRAVCAANGIVNIKDINGRCFLKKLYETGECNGSTLRSNFKDIKEKGVDKLNGYLNKSAHDRNVDPSFIEPFLQERLKWVEYANLIDDMVKNLSYVGLMGEIYQKLEEYRQETNTVLIADTNDLIGQVVKSSDTPFIYERTGTWVDSYMLDEFQDTSAKQYANFVPLLKESLGNGNANLVIGDSKQSIYRFRNADPKIFRESIDTDFSDDLRKENLDTNWRSHKSIIDFNNIFIEKMLALPELSNLEVLQGTYGKKDDYTQKLSGPKEEKPEGLVRIKFGSNPNDAEEQFAKIDEVMETLIDDLWDMHKRFEWKDINILVNTRSDGTKVVNALMADAKKHPERGRIPVMSGESLLLEQSAAVRRVVSMLRFIDLTSYAMDEDAGDDTQAIEDEKNFVNKRRLKKQRQFRVLEDFETCIAASLSAKAEEKAKEKEENGQPADKELDAEEVGRLLQKCFAEAQVTSGKPVAEQMKEYAQDLAKRLPEVRTHTMTLVNIMEHLIRSIGEVERESDSMFLHALLDAAIAFASKRNGGTVREFLRYWDQNKEKITIPDTGNANSIQVLTIHKSKGLEADCVVIPGCGWSIDHNRMDRKYWVEKKDWLTSGGVQMLTDISEEPIDLDDVPTILSLSKTCVRNVENVTRGELVFDGEVKPDKGLFGPIKDKQDQDLTIDNVNKTYVAFTRPRKELHIYCITPEKKQGMTMSDLLNGTVRIPDGHMGMTEVAAGVQYDLGTPIPDLETQRAEAEAARKSKPKKNNLRPKSVIQGGDLPPYKVSKKEVDVSLPQDETAGMMTSARGTRLHNAMSRIGFASQLVKALGYSERRSIITTQEKEQLLAFMTDRLERAPYNVWFANDNTVYNERTMLVALKDGDKRLSSCRPDRVVRCPDGSYVVVDFKFGERNDRGYKQQVQQYMKHLARITGCEVTGYVWYIDMTGDTVQDNYLEVK